MCECILYVPAFREIKWGVKRHSWCTFTEVRHVKHFQYKLISMDFYLNLMLAVRLMNKQHFKTLLVQIGFEPTMDFTQLTNMINDFHNGHACYSFTSSRKRRQRKLYPLPCETLNTSRQWWSGTTQRPTHDTRRKQ